MAVRPYNNVLVAGWVQIARRLQPQPSMKFSVKVILRQHKMLLDHANSDRSAFSPRASSPAWARF
jgi:hypothetical protein